MIDLLSRSTVITYDKWIVTFNCYMLECIECHVKLLRQMANGCWRGAVLTYDKKSLNM